MKSSEILREALRRMGPNGEGWIQLNPGGLFKGCATGPVGCVVVHMLRASGADTSAMPRPQVYLQAIESVYGALGVPDGYRNRLSIFNWNDAPGRTFGAVREMMLAAIALAEADEKKELPAAAPEPAPSRELAAVPS